MNKMTHVKFNLNNFLFTLSDLIDTTNQFKDFSSKRVAYIAIKIAKLNMFESNVISDLLSYSCIQSNSYLLSQINKIPFNNHDNIKDRDFQAILELAIFVEKEFSYDGEYEVNQNRIIDSLEQDNKLDEIFKENLLYLMEFDYFWLDLTNQNSLPFKILDMIDDFTIEYPYEDLINLSQLFYHFYQHCTYRAHQTDIGLRLKIVAEYYNFDEKDTARLMIGGYLSYIGNLHIHNNTYFDNRSETLKKSAHAYFTKEYISRLFGFDDISELASSFAENIDGSGYPFKKSSSELSLKSRLFIIVHRLQALEENKNYKKEDIEEILYQEAKKGLIDTSMLKDILSLTHT